MSTAISLPFSSLSSIQVVVRLGNGEDDSSLSLEPAFSIFSSRPDMDNVFSDPANNMHFQLCNEGGETLLRVFAMGDLERSPPQYDPFLLPTPADDLQSARTIPVSSNASGQISIQDHVYFDCDEFDPDYGTMYDRFPESQHPENSQCNTGDIRNLFNFDVESVRLFPDPSSMISSPAHTPTPSLIPSSSVAGSPFLESSSSHHSPSQADSMPVEDNPIQPAPPKARACKRRKLSCTFAGCDRRFTSNYTLKLHVDAHLPKKRLWFPCTAGCSEQFSRQHDRLRHEVAKHRKLCEWVCGECDRFFSTNRTLVSHKCPNAPAQEFP